MASISKRPDGRWRARYRDANGKEHAKHFNRKIDGQRWLDEVTTAVVTGQYVHPKAGRITVEQYASQVWLPSLSLRASSRREYEGALSRHLVPALGSMPMSSVRPVDARALLMKLEDRLSPRTARRIYGHARSLFRHAEPLAIRAYAPARPRPGRAAGAAPAADPAPAQPREPHRAQVCPEPGRRHEPGRAATAALVVYLGAAAVLDAEREAPDANITSFGDALWWACSTITTVGYGDRYPVTTAGRLVAVVVMFVGIALLGVLTAGLAAWLLRQSTEAAATRVVAAVEKAEGEEERAQDQLGEELDQVLAGLAALDARVRALQAQQP